MPQQPSLEQVVRGQTNGIFNGLRNTSLDNRRESIGIQFEGKKLKLSTT